MRLRGFSFILLLSLTEPTTASPFYVGIFAGSAEHEATLELESDSLDPVLGFDFQKDYQAPETSSSTYTISLGYKLGKDLALEVGYTKIKTFEGEKRTFIDLSIPVNPGDTPTDNLNTNLFAEEAVETDFTSVAFVGKWSIYKGLSLHAKLGLAAWNYSYTQVLTDIDDTALEQARAAGGCPAPTPCPAPIPNPIPLPSSIDPADYDPALVMLNEIRTESYSDTGIDVIYGLGIGYAMGDTFEIRLDAEMHSFNPKFRNINVEADMLILSFGIITYF